MGWERRPGIVGVEQHGLGGGAGMGRRALGKESGVAGVLHVDHAELQRGAQQALGCLGVLDGYDAVGDLDQRAREMFGLDSADGEGVGQIFARAAKIEQEIDADIVEDQRDEADDGELLPSFEPDRCERANTA
jgi:hypothetical protein